MEVCLLQVIENQRHPVLKSSSTDPLRPNLRENSNVTDFRADIDLRGEGGTTWVYRQPSFGVKELLITVLWTQIVVHL